MRNSARVLLLTTVCCYPLFGQAKRGGSSTGTGPGTTTTTPATNTPPTNNPTTTPQPTSPTISQPMYISGRVIMDDGSPLPSSITIVRVCNGVTRAMGY